MKQISLISITLGSFLSFRQETTIHFSETPGLKLISGENLVEPRLGANGAGKSAIFDALCFCLFGTGVHGERAADLISDDARQTSVFVTLRINNEFITIHRTAPPNRLYLEANEERKQVEQYEIEQLIGLSRNRFLHSVLFGQDSDLFIDLSIPDRGELLDEVLDLAYWLRAADAAGARYNKQNAELSTLRTGITRVGGQLEGLENIDTIEAEEDAWERERDNRIERVISAIEEIEQETGNLDDELIAAREEYGQIDVDKTYKAYKTKHNIFSNLRSVRVVAISEVESLQERLVFFKENPTCPTCEQTISKDWETHALAEIEWLRAEINERLEKTNKEIDIAETAMKNAHDQWQSANARRSAFAEQIIRINSAIENRDFRISDYTGQAERIAAEKNPHSARKAQAQKLRDELLASLTERQEQEKECIRKLTQFEFWKQGFRRVRLFCLKRVLRQLELETMNAANALGLVGWHVFFSTETETKSGTLKTGVQIEIQTPEYKRRRWSGGEGQRILLCVALGLAGLIQRWAGVIYNFEVFDEPSAWLSEEGIVDLLECLRMRAETRNKSIWCCDHRALTYGGFSEIWKVTKRAEGSSIYLISETA